MDTFAKIFVCCGVVALLIIPLVGLWFHTKAIKRLLRNDLQINVHLTPNLSTSEKQSQAQFLQNSEKVVLSDDEEIKREELRDQGKSAIVRD